MSRKNQWRRRGNLEFRRLTGRYHDGSLAEYDVLWVRTAGRKPRGVAYCIKGHDSRWYNGRTTAGLGIYIPGNEHSAVAIGKAMRRLAYERHARGGKL